MDNIEKNKASFLGHIKLCTLFQSHQWIQTGVTVQKCSIPVKKGNCLSCVTLKFDRWPWKTTWHLFYATSSFLRHFIVISRFKLELQSGDAKFGSKSAIFVPCDLEIWRRNFENNKAPHFSYFKLCASFHSHRSIQTVVAVRKRLIPIKIDDFCPVWPWNLTFDLEKR